MISLRLQKMEFFSGDNLLILLFFYQVFTISLFEIHIQKSIIFLWCSKLINVAVPGTIDDRAVNTKRVLNPWERNENHTLCLNSAKAIGCTVVNIGTQDFIEGRVCKHEMYSDPSLYQLVIF